MVVDANGAVQQQTDYYPFGLELASSGTSNNKYKYNGKEKQDDAIGSGTLDWLDYGARMYDPSLGRFMTHDPLSEEYNFQSNYVYAINNPIRFTDFMGMGPDDKVHKHKVDNQMVTYKLIDDENNIHQTTHTDTQGTATTTYNEDGSVTQVSNITTTTSIINSKGEIESTSQTVTSTSKKSTFSGRGHGGANFSEKVLSSTSETNSNYDISNNPQAAAFANNVSTQLEANNLWNPWNQAVGNSIATNIAIGDAGIAAYTKGKRGLGVLVERGVKALTLNSSLAAGARALSNSVIWGSTIGVGLGDYYRTNADHSGRSINYSVGKDGQVRKL